MIASFARISSALFTLLAFANGIPAHGGEVDRETAIQHLLSIGVEFDQRGDQIVGARLLQSSATDSDVKYLAAITSLRSIDFGQRRFTDAAMQHVTKLPHLRTVNLSLCPITNQGLQVLVENEKLRSLGLAGTKITDLKPLERLTALKSLDLQHCAITDSELEHLGKIDSLRSVDLGSTEVTDDGVAHLSALGKLKELSLAGCRITDSGVMHLADCSELRDLWLAYAMGNSPFPGKCHVSAQAFEALQKKLPKLNISGEAGGQISGRVGVFRNDEVVVRQVTADQLMAIPDRASVRMIDFSASLIDDEQLAQIADFENLRTLDLSRTWVTDSTVQEISKLPHLEKLDLGDTRITDEGVAALATCEKLESLTLKNSPISGSCFEKLLGLKNLVELDLSRIGSSRWSARLSMAPRLSDRELEMVSKLTWLKRLRLSSVESNLTRKGVRHLLALKNLDELNIYGAPIDDELLEELIQALPNTKLSTGKGSFGQDTQG